MTFQYTMPFLVLNLGGEMIYILQQRLEAQKISAEKSRRVLQDVVRVMLHNEFVEELFNPADLYTFDAVRAVFARLAHSSIMRLSEGSMGKLYDLMTMGFKYQVTSCTSARDIVNVTFVHLNNMKAIVDHSAVSEIIDLVGARVTNLVSRMRPYDFEYLRMSLFSFCQDRRVKVSLFLQTSLQNADGSIVIRGSGPLPTGTRAPGTIQYFKNGRPIEEVAFITPLKVTSEDRTGGSPPLGSNLYASSGGAAAAAAGGSADAGSGSSKAKAKAGDGGGGGSAAGSSVAADSSAKFGGNVNTANAQANMLTSILGLTATSTANDDEFSVNLFPEPVVGARGGMANVVDEDGQEVIYLEVERGSASAYLASNAQVGAIYNEMKAAGGPRPGEDDDDDDLLNMMDRVAK